MHHSCGACRSPACQCTAVLHRLQLSSSGPQEDKGVLHQSGALLSLIAQALSQALPHGDETTAL